MRYYHVEYRPPDDAEHKRIACLLHPNEQLALLSFNAIGAKRECGGKRFKFYSGDATTEWQLLDGDGERFPLVEED